MGLFKIKKRKITSIKIRRAEGRGPDVGKWRTFKNTQDADAFLRKQARSMQHNIGYDKHDVLVKWDSGNSWKGRWDVKKDGTDTSIKKHIKSELDYILRKRKNDYPFITKQDKKLAKVFRRHKI